MPSNSKTRPRLIAKIKTFLFYELGDECDECGDDSDLQIDHPWGRDWTPREVSSYERWLRYAREHQQGLIRLLCRDCNNRIRPVKNKEGKPMLRPPEMAEKVSNGHSTNNGNSNNDNEPF